MPRRMLLLLLLCISVYSLRAQDLAGIEIHGFATQGFLYSSHNNYLSMQSSSGSSAWTDGAVSVTDSLTDNFRVGIQLHTCDSESALIEYVSVTPGALGYVSRVPPKSDIKYVPMTRR